MHVFIWELIDGPTVAAVADTLESAITGALGNLDLAERGAPSYSKKADCRKLRTLIQSGAIPQSAHVGSAPYVFIMPSPEPKENEFKTGSISIGSMVNSQVAIASPEASYSQMKGPFPLEDLRQVILDLRSVVKSLPLDTPTQRELDSQAATIEMQLQREAPSRSIIGECLRSVRAILEGVAGNILASPILLKLNPILQQCFF